jgi:RNA polymerase sigma-70 factor, ECF subfamily
MDWVPDFADEPVERMADSEELAAAGAVLARLRRSEREVFTLCVWSGPEYAEAARALGVPVGAVALELLPQPLGIRAMFADRQVRPDEL